MYHKFRNRIKNTYFGWWIVLASGTMTLWANSIYVYGFGVFFKPLISEFGWSRAVTSGASSFGKLEGGLEGPIAGVLIDKYGPRIVCIVGFFLAGLGLILMSQVNSIFSFYLFWLITSTGFNLATGSVLFKAVTDWFIKKMGLALSISKGGYAIGGAIMPILLTTLLFMYNWRWTFIIIAISTWIITLPLSWFVIKPHRPEFYGLLPDGAKNKKEIYESSRIITKKEDIVENIIEREFTAKEAFRTRTFWITGIVFAIRGMIAGVVDVHTIPLLTDMGMDPMSAAQALGLLVGVSLPGRILGGIIADKCKVEQIRFLLILGLIGICVSFLILLNSGSNVILVYLYIIVYGTIGLGICATIIPVIKARYFGRKAFSTIDGVQILISAVAGIIAPVYAGWIYDITNSYLIAFETLFGFAILAIILMYFAKPPHHN